MREMAPIVFVAMCCISAAAAVTKTFQPPGRFRVHARLTKNVQVVVARLPPKLITEGRSQPDHNCASPTDILERELSKRTQTVEHDSFKHETTSFESDHLN